MILENGNVVQFNGDLKSKVDQIIDEAYEKGYNKCREDYETKMDMGISAFEVWDAAVRVLGYNKDRFSTAELYQLFGTADKHYIINNFSPVEVIEKVREFDEERMLAEERDGEDSPDEIFENICKIIDEVKDEKDLNRVMAYRRAIANIEKEIDKKIRRE